MGICWSSPQHLLDDIANGNEDDYHRTFLEDKVLGEGEFGVVRIVRNVQTDTDWACKVLRKGAVFKDNVLYAPIRPAILRGEVEMLRTLQKTASSFCLQLHSVYEGPSRIYLVTEQCKGGELMEWVAAQESDLTVDVVARISRQLMSAVDHCYKHKILHRDIKPANIMFMSKEESSDIRLIDFGSGCMDSSKVKATDQLPADKLINGNLVHTTYAGTAFYMAPEVFHQPYTIMVDVWSAAVSIYVLVAGYPSQNLQRAFNILQKSSRSLKDLPGHEDSVLPDTYFGFLTEALTYHYRSRPTAGALLRHEFLATTAAAAATTTAAPEEAPSQQQSIAGSVRRHSVFLDFQKFERSLTTLLAAMLSKAELKQLLEATTTTASTSETSQLPVVLVQTLLEQATRLQPILADTIAQQLPGSAVYHNFAYHTAMLKEFAGDGGGGGDDTRSTRSLSRRRFSRSSKKSALFVSNSMHGNSNSNNKVHAQQQKAASSFVSKPKSLTKRMSFRLHEL